MMKKNKFFIILAVIWSGTMCAYLCAEDQPAVLSLNKFVTNASRNDITFQEILVEELAITYKSYLSLPVRDWVLSVQGQYDSVIDNTDANETEGRASLRKLFPYIGTDFEAQYNTTVNQSTNDAVSSYEISLSQSIAENAFGKADRYLKQITDIEEKLAHYQIVEAYEDYLATIITLYYNWYFAYENLKTGESSYRENFKQLDQMIARKKSNIAHDVDVNKIKLQVLAKKERVIELSDAFERTQNKIKQAYGEQTFSFMPEEDPAFYKTLNKDFEEEYKLFLEESRTADILNLLIDKSEIELKKDANALLPSIDLTVGYSGDGEDFGFADPENIFFAGVSLEFPYKSEQEHARRTIAEVNRKKTSLSSQNTHRNLYTELLNLYQRVKKTEELITNSQERIRLAESILKDELKNYSLGQATLNETITAINNLENNQFNKINYSVRLKLLVTEWFRITDQLVVSRLSIKQ